MGGEIAWLGRHEGWLRLVSRGVKDGKPWAINKAAMLFDTMLPDNGRVTLVPMPSHSGYATTMLEVCYAVATRRKDVTIVRDILECSPHESHYDVKKRGEMPSPIHMSVKDRVSGQVVILDNCIGTGVTARCALQVLPNAMVMSITKGS